MDEQRKHAIRYAAALLSARKLLDWMEAGKRTMAKQLWEPQRDATPGLCLLVFTPFHRHHFHHQTATLHRGCSFPHQASG
jgi:hypothetical protein